MEIGDYVNGDKIFNIDDCKGAMRQFYYDYENPNDDAGHWEEEIKSVITHEQMEQMEYKVRSKDDKWKSRIKEKTRKLLLQ